MPDLFVLTIVYCLGLDCNTPQFHEEFIWPIPFTTLGECGAAGIVAEEVLKSQGKKIIDNRCEGK